MATPFLAPAFVTGELSPSVFGRVDLDREHVAASTMRNLFVNYRGGAYSRAGTSFVGFSKQTGRDFPPRLIPFQFNINQGLALEFGHEYMRVILDGAFVVETPISIGGASQADPAVLTFGAEGASAATPNNAAVTFSYAPGDLVTLAGGTELTPAVLAVTTSELVSILAKLAGTGYAINDTITLAGGTSSTSAIAKVASVIAVSATGFVTFSVNPSDGDTVTLNGVAWTFKTAPTTVAQTQIQSTLAGTLAQLAADLNASANGSLTVATYSSTPKTINVAYTATGTGGNAYTLAASVAVPSAGTLTGGTTTGIGLLTINTAVEMDMLEGAAAALEGLDGVELVVRNHPFSRVESHSRFAALRNKIRVSNATLEEDVASADALLFTYSTVGEESLLRGKPAWQWLPLGFNAPALSEIADIPRFSNAADLRAALRRLKKDPGAFIPAEEMRRAVAERLFHHCDGGAARRIAAEASRLLDQSASAASS